MKKLTTLLLAAGMVVSSFAGASAAEFKPSAAFVNQYTWGTTGQNQLMSLDTPNFQARTQIQLGFDYIASENLSGTFLLRVRQNYGSGEFDAQWKNQENSSTAGAMLVRLAYIDWMIPSTDISVRMGYQPVSLPAFAFGSAVLDARGSGITVNAPINDNIAVTALWTRMYASNDDGLNVNGNNGNGNNQYADLFALVADFNYDGFRIAPWVAYANMKTNGTLSGLADLSFTLEYDSDGNIIDGNEFYNAKTSAWLVGASFELSMFDPFTFALDAYYSNISADQNDASNEKFDADGFFIGASASYKLDFATPSLKAWYASGSKSRENSNDDFIGAAYFAPCFGATSIMFDNYIMTDAYVEQANGASPSGLWGILLDVSDISFIENLSHQFIIAYMEGTNEYEYGTTKENWSGSGVGSSLSSLGKDDSVIEVNFNSTYQIYKNLSTTLQLGWLAPNFEYESADNNYNDDILRAAISFTYKF